MLETKIPIIHLNNGLSMPQLGLGVWKTPNQLASDAVSIAIENGYSLIDTAKQYGNERGVGDGITQSILKNKITRNDLFITTKIYNGDQGYNNTLSAIDDQLSSLQVNQVDLLLMHWPVDNLYLETWRAMEKIYLDGKAKAIGVCNFDIDRLTNLLNHSKIAPTVNQIEFNPLVHQQEIIDFCNKNQIQIEAWSPLGNGKALNNPIIQKIASNHSKSPAQVILRWETQKGLIVIPKSIHIDRIIENKNIFDFSLSTSEIEQIDDLNQEHRSLWYNNFQWNGNPNGLANSIANYDD